MAAEDGEREASLLDVLTELVDSCHEEEHQTLWKNTKTQKKTDHQHSLSLHTGPTYGQTQHAPTASDDMTLD